jgi:hypothetical protein
LSESGFLACYGIERSSAQSKLCPNALNHRVGLRSPCGRLVPTLYIGCLRRQHFLVAMLYVGLRRQHFLVATLYIGLRRQHFLVATLYVGLCRQHFLVATLYVGLRR